MKENDNKYKAVELSDEELEKVTGGGYHDNLPVTVTDGMCGHGVDIKGGKCTTKFTSCIGCKYA